MQSKITFTKESHGKGHESFDDTSGNLILEVWNVPTLVDALKEAQHVIQIEIEKLNIHDSSEILKV